MWRMAYFWYGIWLVIDVAFGGKRTFFKEIHYLWRT